MTLENRIKEELEEIKEKTKIEPYPNWNRGVKWGIVWGCVGSLITMFVGGMQYYHCTTFGEFMTNKKILLALFKGGIVLIPISFVAIFLPTCVLLAYRPIKRSQS